MNIFSLVWNYLKAKPLNTALNILLLALGIGVITILILFNNQLEEKIASNARGIDLVVGAKGSPLQLILCNIFHIDFPTGNINLKEAENLANNRLIKNAVPLALGDSYQGFRIVGTTKAYPELYQLTLQEGAWWDGTLEVTVGSNVARVLGLRLNNTFASTHGLTTIGHAHEEQKFKVVGILKQTGTIADNLILTSVQSIWYVHEEHSEESGERNPIHTVGDSLVSLSKLIPDHKAVDSTKEITAMLIQYRTPMAAIQLPRIVNNQSSMQAASPAFETARLFTILGVGVDVLMGFAGIIIFVSALSIFIALYNSLKERRYDLAIMRSMGATRAKVMMTIISEGCVLTLLGSVLGGALGHAVVMTMNMFVEESQKAGITGLVFYSQEWILLAGSLLLGVLCAFIPAWQAYRTDISKVLAGN
jgi:putative ABC transport system permease protein